jgi:uncharacterized membrane protein
MTSEPSFSSTATTSSPWRTRRGIFLLGGALAIIGLFVAAPPQALWDKARLIGYAICHQMPERSFFFHEHQSPLCARCTGMYLGLLLGVLFLIIRRRTHAARLPSASIVAVMIGFIVIMGIDGLNSTISIIPGAPQLYHTTNVHRIITGSLYGLAMAMLFLPMLNTAVWRLPSGDPSLKNWRELLGLVVVILVIDALVLTTPDWLFYPITIISIVGPLLLLGFMGAIIVLTLRNLANLIDRWRQMIAPLIIGAAFGLILITIMDIFRAAVTNG